MKERRNILIAVAAGIGLAVVLMAAFFFGVFVGKHDSRFFPNKEKRHPILDFFPRKFEGHGVLGTIQTLGDNILVVKDRTGAIKTILVDSQTKIRRGRSSINFSDLKTNEGVIVLGEPQKDEEAIKAKIIRVMGTASKEATGSGMLYSPRFKYLGS